MCRHLLTQHMSLMTKCMHARRLRAEGISEEEAHRAVPYAAQALGIASACVGGVGLAATGVVYASGVDMKASAQVSSVQDALQTADRAGAWVSAKLQRWGEQHVAPLLPSMQGQEPQDTSSAQDKDRSARR